MPTNGLRNPLAQVAVALLLAANIILPLVSGDVYPFTSAPMFRDSPTAYCNYRVSEPDGKQLPAVDWLVQRIYDGNPVGYGVGVRPPAVLEAEFGVIHDEATVRRHIEGRFSEKGNDRHEFVVIEQEIIAPVDSQRLGVIETKTWRVYRPN
jgi:hypothetical protein